MKKLFYFFAILMALYSLPSLAQGDPSPAVNMDKYITLTVQSGKDIRLNFKAAQANTPVRIVSGTNTHDITVGTDWYNTDYTVTSNGTTMTIYGDIIGFNCSYNLDNLTSLDVSKNTQLTYLNCGDNNLTSLDISKNTQLIDLYCYWNQLTSLDVSKNTQLTSLLCEGNQLTSLDVSKNTQLTGLDCYGNQLTSLDVSNNTQLTKLSCGSNQLTSLDVSKNTQLTKLYCYGNKFTTESMNELYCSLPEREEQNKGVINPVYKQDDANHAEIVATTSDNARNKNWKVKYGEWNIRELDVPSNGNYECSNTNHTPNMSKYITLTVQSGKDIRLNFKAPQANTPVRIVSGSNTQNITVGTDWYVASSFFNDNYTVTSDGTTMTIYGDIIGFNCSYNQDNLTSLDLSNNSQLTRLDCYINQLTSLDLSNNTQLNTLDCTGNELTSLDLSNNTKLTELVCRKNRLTSLDVSKNTQLATLDCGLNKLTSLDVSKNTQLTELGCGLNKLTSLDVSKNTQLTELGCGRNQLTSLDVSKNTQLTRLSCGYNQLTSLDVSKNTQLTRLYCSYNQLTSLDVSKNTQLTELYCYNNPFTTEALNKLYCSLPDRQGQNKGVIRPVYKQDDANHAEIVAATSDNARAKNWEVKYDELKIEELDVPSNGNYECSNTNPTPNMSKYITLTVQSGKDIRLNFKAPQANTPVRIVSGTNTQDITVGTNWYFYDELENDNFSVKSDGTTMTIYGDITGFICSENGENLTSLDVSKNTQLTYLNCHDNELTSLDVSKNTQLTTLHCSSNQLTSLDVSKNTQLTVLDCGGNQLTSLDVSKNTQLAYLYCHGNRLTSLDVSNNTQLTTLVCSYNRLTSLDVSKNTQLTGLSCSSNQLTSLDLSNNTQLTGLWCQDNRLTSLDLSNNTQLTTLWCQDNRLTSLDLSNNTQLTELYCDGNKFTTESMNELYCSLPDRQGQYRGEIYSLYKKDDANHAEIVAATSDNARAKNWKVNYFFSQEYVPSNGNYDCNSGVDEHLSSGISVFPNPASGKVQIKLSESVNETLILVDLAGRAVLLTDVISGEATIDVSNLTAGTYFIRIGNITKKLTVK